MLLRGSIAALAFGVSALTGAPYARADEAYVCDAGRVVYVKPGELEAMKRSDPCIASYYGITLTPAPSGASAKPARAPAVDFKTLGGPEDQARAAKPSAPKLAQLDTVVPAPRAPPVASPGTDFRNVRLINAAPNSTGWYRHTH